MKLNELLPKPGTYLAFVLADSSRNKLLKLFPPKFSKILAHHVTIEFNPTQEKLEQLKASLGDKFKIKAFGYSWDHGVDCISISLNEEVKRLDGSFYHVTLSVEPPIKPVASNDLLRSLNGIPIETIDEIILIGKLELLSK